MGRTFDIAVEPQFDVTGLPSDVWKVSDLPFSALFSWGYAPIELRDPGA